LVFRKNQYGPLGETIMLRYQRGLFLPEAGASSLEKLARESKCDEVFMYLLRRFAGQNRNVSDKKTSPNYAPTTFVEETESKKHTIRKEELKDAMRRLFDANKIYVESYGKASRLHSRLAVKL
jgi:RecA-family ATPase